MPTCAWKIHTLPPGFDTYTSHCHATPTLFLPAHTPAVYVPGFHADHFCAIVCLHCYFVHIYRHTMYCTTRLSAIPSVCTSGLTTCLATVPFLLNLYDLNSFKPISIHPVLFLLYLLGIYLGMTLHSAYKTCQTCHVFHT